MKYQPRTIGLFQAAGLIVYVSLFATIIQFISQSSFSNSELPPIVGITIFLLTFVISATICSSIFFAYPIIFFFDNKRNEAYKIVLWSLSWLLIFFIIFLVIVFTVLSMK